MIKIDYRYLCDKVELKIKEIALYAVGIIFLILAISVDLDKIL